MTRSEGALRRSDEGIRRWTIHIVCAPKQDYLAIVTAYVPSLIEWEKNLKIRKRR